MIEDEQVPGAVEAPEATQEPAVPGTATAIPTSRGGRLPWIVATVAVLVALATIVVAAVLLSEARAASVQRDAVEQAAGQFALELTTWDASDGMADTRESLRRRSAGFAEDVDQLFGGTDDLATLEEVGARSEGEVRDVLVQSLEGEEAEALAVVVQRVTTDVTEGEEISLRYALLTLRRDGGAWRVDDVELVVDALQQTAERADPTQLPGFGEPGTDVTDAGETDAGETDAEETP
jgi:hypothetical protein